MKQVNIDVYKFVDELLDAYRKYKVPTLVIQYENLEITQKSCYCDSIERQNDEEDKI